MTERKTSKKGAESDAASRQTTSDVPAETASGQDAASEIETGQIEAGTQIDTGAQAEAGMQTGTGGEAAPAAKAPAKASRRKSGDGKSGAARKRAAPAETGDTTSKVATSSGDEPEIMTSRSNLATQEADPAEADPVESAPAQSTTDESAAAPSPANDEATPAAKAEVETGQIPPPGPRPVLPKRVIAKAETFREGDHVVYPTHGVGKVERVAPEEIAGHKLDLIHITFDENRMTLRVPVNKARTAGLRKLSTREQFDKVLGTLKGKARVKRTMWSRRAQEYEAKINSGDPIAIAEVVRDLHRNSGQPDQSFSERQIFEAALDRLAAEYAVLENVDKLTATDKLIDFLKTV